MTINVGNTKAAASVPAGKGVTGSTLKMIAITAMLIDHIAAIVLVRILMAQESLSVSLVWVYQVMRLIGRMGFPIFCFLLIEGFVHTRNVKKYAGRLFLFALLSEIPFDMGFAGECFYWQYQNVFFTLFVGLVVLAGFRFVEEKQEWNAALRSFLSLLILAAGMALAQLLMTDYSYIGVLTIALMYRCRKNRLWEAGAGCLALTLFMWNEFTSFLILPAVWKYNGRRGWNLKWAFYIFYPAHILLLYVIACALGLGHIAAI